MNCFKITTMSIATLLCSFLLTPTTTHTLTLNKIASTECSKSFIDGSFSALFLKPATIHFEHAQAITQQSPDCQPFSLNPHFDVGFDTGLTVFLHKRNLIVNLNWTGFHTLKSKCKQAPAAEISQSADISRSLELPYAKMTGKGYFAFDCVNLNFGRVVSFRDFLLANLFVGINYSRIHQNLISTSSFSNHDDTVERIAQITAMPIKFQGAGPQGGIEFCFSLGRGFQLTGLASLALLIGDTKGEIKNLSSLTHLNIEEICLRAKQQIVPLFKERIGFAYYRTFCECYVGMLEIGFEAMTYLNALRVVSDNESVAPALERKGNNFSLFGPYISFGLLF